MIVLEGFVERLNDYLRCNELTNQKLAKRLDCSSTYISYLLAHKRNPSKNFIDKLAMATGKTPTWWLHGDPEDRGLVALDELLDMLIKNKIVKSIQEYENNTEIKDMIQSMIKAELRFKLKKKGIY